MIGPEIINAALKKLTIIPYEEKKIFSIVSKDIMKRLLD
jgi:hypothetical protein